MKDDAKIILRVITVFVFVGLFFAIIKFTFSTKKAEEDVKIKYFNAHDKCVSLSLEIFRKTAHETHDLELTKDIIAEFYGRCLELELTH